MDLQHRIQERNRIIEEIFRLFIAKISSNARSCKSLFAEDDFWLRLRRKKLGFLDNFDSFWLFHWGWELFEDLANAGCCRAFDFFDRLDDFFFGDYRAPVMGWTIEKG